MEATYPASDRPLEERRRYPRLNLKDATRFRELLKPQNKFAGSLSRDVSAGGISFTSSLFLPKEARLVTLLTLPDSLKELRSICRVAWVRKQPYADQYHFGLQFVEILPEDREAIALTVERGALPSGTSTPDR